jgi:hypothetical protein
MRIPTFSSRAYDRDAKTATQHGQASIADLLSLPGSEDIELVIPARRDVAQAADLS